MHQSDDLKYVFLIIIIKLNVSGPVGLICARSDGEDGFIVVGIFFKWRLCSLFDCSWGNWMNWCVHNKLVCFVLPG